MRLAAREKCPGTWIWGFQRPARSWFLVEAGAEAAALRVGRFRAPLNEEGAGWVGERPALLLVWAQWAQEPRWVGQVEAGGGCGGGGIQSWILSVGSLRALWGAMTGRLPVPKSRTAAHAGLAMGFLRLCCAGTSCAWAEAARPVAPRCWPSAPYLPVSHFPHGNPPFCWDCGCLCFVLKFTVNIFLKRSAILSSVSHHLATACWEAAVRR